MFLWKYRLHRPLFRKLRFTPRVLEKCEEPYIFAFTNYNLPDSTAIRLFGLDPSDQNNTLSGETMSKVNYILILAKSAISTAKFYNSSNYSMYFENHINLRKKYFENPN